MSKGKISDIKPGMLVQLEVSSGPDLGIVYHADTDIFNVLLLDNSKENVPARIDADDIICAWNLSQLAPCVIRDLLKGRGSGWKSALDLAIVYRSTSTESVEMTLEEISELVSKQLGKQVSVSVKDAKPEGVEPRTEVFVVPESGVIDHEAQVGEEFEIKGVRYRAIADTRDCAVCALKSDGRCGYYGGTCSPDARFDGESIIFERVPPEDEDEYEDDVSADVAIGDTINLGGTTFICEEDDCEDGCTRCNLSLARYCEAVRCYRTTRRDGKSVHFVKVSDNSKATCKSSETADMRKGQKPSIASEIHDLYEVEPAVGVIIEDNGNKLKVVESDLGCDVCYFCDDDVENCKHIICAGRHRKDGKNIILQEVREEE
jgi:hypothetical protein